MRSTCSTNTECRSCRRITWVTRAIRRSWRPRIGTPPRPGLPSRRLEAIQRSELTDEHCADFCQKLLPRERLLDHRCIRQLAPPRGVAHDVEHLEFRTSVTQVLGKSKA